MLSFTVRGTPSRGPNGARSSHRFSLASAAKRAPSRSRVTTALILGLILSRRSRTDRKKSIGENFPFAYPETRSAADRCQRKSLEIEVGMFGLDTDNGGDRCGARSALVLCSAGDENSRIVRNGSNHGPERCSGVSLIVDVCVGQHGCSPAPNSAVGTGIRLGEYPTDPLGLFGGGGSRELQSGVG